jgi:hypothetical protein
MALIRCKECGDTVSTKAAACPHCGAPVVRARKKPGGCLTAVALLGIGWLIIMAITTYSPPDKRASSQDPNSSTALPSSDEAQGQSEPTRASQSEYNQDIIKATTSVGLSKADLAWHALNTYGWDCNEVVSREERAGSYFIITCSSGIRLRVYPRVDQHPRITNIKATYESL